MILSTVTFGRCPEGKDHLELSELAEEYLGYLMINGQICGEYLFAWSSEVLAAYAYVAQPNSCETRFHSRRAKTALKELSEKFEIAPVWSIVQDDVAKRFSSWKSASNLYLFTHWFDKCSPVNHGDNGSPLPAYQFPLSDETKENIRRWADWYKVHDQMWLLSGSLEIPAYKQLADPESEVSQTGRELCREIEEATGKPTYYYLMRYWGRSEREQNRLCPGCGTKWNVATNLETAEFWEFSFRCKQCRLVSNEADSFEDERHARIGEWRPKKK